MSEKKNDSTLSDEVEITPEKLQPMKGGSDTDVMTFLKNMQQWQQGNEEAKQKKQADRDRNNLKQRAKLGKLGTSVDSVMHKVDTVVKDVEELKKNAVSKKELDDAVKAALEKQNEEFNRRLATLETAKAVTDVLPTATWPAPSRRPPSFIKPKQSAAIPTEGMDQDAINKAVLLERAKRTLGLIPVYPSEFRDVAREQEDWTKEEIDLHLAKKFLIENLGLTGRDEAAIENGVVRAFEPISHNVANRLYAEFDSRESVAVVWKTIRHMTRDEGEEKSIKEYVPGPFMPRFLAIHDKANKIYKDSLEAHKADNTRQIIRTRVRMGEDDYILMTRRGGAWVEEDITDVMVPLYTKTERVVVKGKAATFSQEAREYNEKEREKRKRVWEDEDNEQKKRSRPAETLLAGDSPETTPAPSLTEGSEARRRPTPVPYAFTPPAINLQNRFELLASPRDEETNEKLVQDEPGTMGSAVQEKIRYFTAVNKANGSALKSKPKPKRILTGKTVSERKKKVTDYFSPKPAEPEPVRLTPPERPVRAMMPETPAGYQGRAGTGGVDSEPSNAERQWQLDGSPKLTARQPGQVIYLTDEERSSAVKFVNAALENCPATANVTKAYENLIVAIYQETKEFARTHKANLNLAKEGGKVVCYTDGSCQGQGREDKEERWAGAGVYWGKGHKVNVAAPVPGKAQTNNVGELLAVVIAIAQGLAMGLDELTVKSDSSYSLGACTKGIKLWKSKGGKISKTQACSNIELLKLADLAMQRVDGVMKVNYRKVLAHAKLVGNEVADRLANVGAELRREP